MYARVFKFIKFVFRNVCNYVLVRICYMGVCNLVLVCFVCCSFDSDFLRGSGSQTGVAVDEGDEGPGDGGDGGLGDEGDEAKEGPGRQHPRTSGTIIGSLRAVECFLEIQEQYSLYKEM